MTTINLTEDTFADTVSDNPIVLVDFWAAWCGPCRMFAPVYETVSESNPDIVFAKVDTEAEQGLAAAASIRSIPTLMVFKNGELASRQVGAAPKSQLKSWLVGELV